MHLLLGREAGRLEVRPRTPVASQHALPPPSGASCDTASRRAAIEDIGLSGRHRPRGMRENNRAENSHLVIRRRERKQQKFKSQGSAQRFLASEAAVSNTFSLQPHLLSPPSLRILRAQANRAWNAATAAA